MTLAHLLLTEGGTQQVTRCKHKHNDNRGKISDARESAVTLCCVAFFIHLPPPPDVWCVLCMWGPSVQHRPGGPWCQGRLRPVLVTGPGSVLAQTRERRHRQWQGESGQSREETRRLERILSTVTFVARTAENTTECDSDQQRITSYPVRNLESRGLFTGGQPGCDNGKQSQHREPTLVRPAPDLWNCGLDFW